jgi:hypothetical protein
MRSILPILIFAAIATAQTRWTMVRGIVPLSVPNPAVARLCGNAVVPNGDVYGQIELVKSQGCSEVRIIPTDAENSLVFGVKILMGE